MATILYRKSNGILEMELCKDGLYISSHDMEHFQDLDLSAKETKELFLAMKRFYEKENNKGGV